MRTVPVKFSAGAARHGRAAARVTATSSACAFACAGQAAVSRASVIPIVGAGERAFTV